MWNSKINITQYFKFTYANLSGCSSQAITQIKLTLTTMLPFSYEFVVSSTSGTAPCMWEQCGLSLSLWVVFFYNGAGKNDYHQKEYIPWVMVFCYEVMILKRITTSHWTGPRIYVLSLADIWIWLWSQIWEANLAGSFSFFSWFLSICTYCTEENICSLFIWEISSL